MRAFGTSIIVKPVHVKKTETGVLLSGSGTSTVDSTEEGIVTSVGGGEFVGGTLHMDVKEGETVLYRGNKGIKYKKEGEAFKILHFTDIIAKL